MNILNEIAINELLARKRQGIVSLLGIVLGAAFFLAIASLMKGSENDFIRRLVDNSPHIIVVDEYRKPKPQPVEVLFKNALIEIRHLKPETETRGIRYYNKILESLHQMPGVIAAAVLSGQALLNFSGKETAITLNGMNPKEIGLVTTLSSYMVSGKIEDLIENPNGIILGIEFQKKFSIAKNENINLTATDGNIETFKVLGFFKTGRLNIDSTQAYLDIKKAQSLLNRPERANSIIIKIKNPQNAQAFADDLERKIGYKNISWQENSQDLLNTLSIRNRIMYTVVSAVLVVAAFGIYNVISTVVLEKRRDIAILKSMGFHSSHIQKIFLRQGIILGLAGCCFGLPLGSLMMFGISQIRFRPPGGTEIIRMPIDWGITQFIIATTFALAASILAAYLPAKKAARLNPVDILRGGAV